MTTPHAALAARLTRQEGLLRGAVLLECARFLQAEVEGRLRARPRFLGRTPKDALVQLRLRLDRDAERVAQALWQPLLDLRTFLGAAPRGEEDVARSLGKAVGHALGEAARDLLLTYGFPGDDKPDTAEDEGIDLEPRYELGYDLGEPLRWAFGEVLRLDAAQDALRAGGDPTLDTRLLVPEALAEPPGA